MNTSLSSVFANLKTGSPTIHNNLAIVPLFLQENIEPVNYITLDEGLKSSLLEVEELEGNASVSNILFRNKSKEFAIIFEGEELIGAMQNRILNVSVLVTPETTQKLPVSCVEAGRWSHRYEEPENRRFKAANRMHYARGRALGNRATSEQLERSGEFLSDQSEIWADIERKSTRMKVESPTSASDAMYASSQSTIDKYLKSFKHSPKQRGSVFIVNGKVSGLELFASDQTHEKMFGKLIRSYALDAVDSSGSSGKGKSETTQNSLRQNAVRLLASFEISSTLLGRNASMVFVRGKLPV